MTLAMIARDFAPKQFDLFAFGFGFKNLCMEYFKNKDFGSKLLCKIRIWACIDLQDCNIGSKLLCEIRILDIRCFKK